jgi:hypothetical protein
LQLRLRGVLAQGTHDGAQLCGEEDGCTSETQLLSKGRECKLLQGERGEKKQENATKQGLTPAPYLWW